MRVYITINGVTTDLSEGDPLQIIDIANLGASSATRITERSPAQDGDSDIDRTLDPRTIPLIIQAIPDDGQELVHSFSYNAIRALINRLFKATNANTILGITFDDGQTYEINVKSVGDIPLPLNLRSQAVIQVPVTLRAANPTFYNPIQQVVNFALAGAGATLVPTVIPMLVGGATLDQLLSINYAGTYRDFPIILVDGPITNLKIENLTTGRKIDFTGTVINGGDRYTIDLRFGRKLVYRNNTPSDNRLYQVTTDSNLAQFAIEADPDVANGTNSIKVTGTGLTSASAIYVQYFNRYDGI